MRFTSLYPAPLPGFTRIHSGLRSRCCSGTILIGVRAVLAVPVCLGSVLLMLFSFQGSLQAVDQVLRKLRLQFADAGGDAEFAALRDAQSCAAARVDVGERCQIHVHVQREAVVAAAMFYFQSE